MTSFPGMSAVNWTNAATATSPGCRQMPDGQFGEAVKAIVVLRDGAAATADEIMDFCRGRLGGYKRPRSVDFVRVAAAEPERQGAEARAARAVLERAVAPRVVSQ